MASASTGRSRRGVPPPVRCFAFLSAVAPRADINELVVEHQVPILRKPFIVRDLLALVERLLAAP
jgi:hypothetical protein